MWAWFFGIFSLVLLVVVATMGYYLWKFIKIIMVFEDDLTQATAALQEVEQSLERINELRLFFDDETIRGAADEIKNTFRLAQFYVNQTISNFTRRSKQQYITIIEEKPEGEEGGPISPPTSLSPPIRRESTVAHVGRPETAEEAASKKEKI